MDEGHYVETEEGWASTLLTEDQIVACNNFAAGYRYRADNTPVPDPDAEDPKTDDTEVDGEDTEISGEGEKRKTKRKTNRKTNAEFDGEDAEVDGEVENLDGNDVDDDEDAERDESLKFFDPYAVDEFNEGIKVRARHSWHRAASIDLVFKTQTNIFLGYFNPINTILWHINMLTA